MQKIILFLFIFILQNYLLCGQDLIYKRTGQEIKGKVYSISTDEIEYTELGTENITRRILKSEVAIILYSNGKKDIFEEPAQPLTSSEIVSVPVIQGNRPYQRYSRQDIFNEKVPLIFMGIDFSRVVFRNCYEDPDLFFEKTNYLLLDQMPKYDLMGAFRRSSIDYNYKVIDQKNQNLNKEIIKNNVGAAVQLTELQSIIDQYNLVGSGMNDGLGLVLICKSMKELNSFHSTGFIGNSGFSSYSGSSKFNSRSDRSNIEIYYVIFDIASKKVLITELISGRGDDWSEAIYGTINTVKYWKFQQWYRTFGDQ